jgi:HEAT repeat protein
VRRLRKSPEGAALAELVSESVRQAFADASHERAEADWTDAVAREWLPAFTPDVCAALIAGLGSVSGTRRFRGAALSALEEAGADVAELGRVLDVNEFLYVLPQRLYDRLLEASLAPDSALRALVGALLAERAADGMQAFTAEASPRQFRADLVALLVAIEEQALASGLPRYVPPGTGVLDFPTRVRVRKGTRSGAATAPEPYALPAELDPEQRPDKDWQSVASAEGRLVVLGDPGMGKSWLMRQEAARLARSAIEALGAGLPAGDIVLPVPLRCDELVAATGLTLADAATEYLVARYQVPGRSRGGLCTLVSGDGTVLLLDALDELPDKAARQRLDDLLGRWALNPRSRFRLTSRLASYTGIAAPPTTYTEVELLAFTSADVLAVIDAWGLPAHLAERVKAEVRDPALANVARIPLFTALLCAASSSGERWVSVHAAGIYERVLRRFLAQENRWPRTPEAEATEIDKLMGVLAPLAFHFAARPEGWTDRMPAGQIMAVLRSLGTAFSELGLDAAAVLRDLSVRAGILVPSAVQDSGRNPPYLFLHRAFAEYLTAWHMASLPREEWLAVVDEHLWFDLDWRPTLGLLGAAFVQQERPGEAVFLIRHLIAQTPNPFHLALYRAARVVAELPSHDFLPEEIVSELSARLTALIDSPADRDNVAQLLSDCLTRLPRRVTSGLLELAGGEHTGVVAKILANSRDQQVMTRLIELLDDPDWSNEAFSAFEGQDDEILAQALLDRFDNPRQRERSATALVSYTATSVAERMLERLRSPKPRVRYHALQVLRDRDNLAVVEATCELCGDPDAEVRNLAINSLSGRLPTLDRSCDPRDTARLGLAAQSEDRAVAQVLQAGLRDPDPLVRWAARWGVFDHDLLSLDEIIAYAQDPDPEIRADAAAALKAYAELPEARAALISMLGAPEIAVAGKAADSLSESRGDEITALLIGLLDRDPWVAGAYRALRSRDGEESALAIVASISPASDSDRLVAALSALGDMTSATATTALLGYASHENEVVRQAAVGALADHAGPTVTAVLLDALTDGSSAVRRQAILSLRSKAHHSGVATALRARFADESAEVREAAVSVCEITARSIDLLPDVLARFSDPHAAVRRAAAQSLQKSEAADALTYATDLPGYPDLPGLLDLYDAVWVLATRVYRMLSPAQRTITRAGLARLTDQAKLSKIPSSQQDNPTEPADTDYLDAEVVILLQGQNLYGTPVYSYLQITGRNLHNMFVCMKLGINFKPSDFGTVLTSGTGTPPPEVSAEMNDKYDMVDADYPPANTSGFG